MNPTPKEVAAILRSYARNIRLPGNIRLPPGDNNFDDAANIIDSLLIRVERAEAALRPFAEIAERIAADHPGWDHDEFRLFIAGVSISFAPFRAARAALHATEAPAVAQQKQGERK